MRLVAYLPDTGGFPLEDCAFTVNAEKADEEWLLSAIQKISAVREFDTRLSHQLFLSLLTKYIPVDSHSVNDVLMVSDSLLHTSRQMSLRKGQSDEVRSSILVQVYEFNRRHALAHNRTRRLNTRDIDLIEVGIHRKQSKRECQRVSSFLRSDSDHLFRDCENRWQEFLFERGYLLGNCFPEGVPHKVPA